MFWRMYTDAFKLGNRHDFWAQRRNAAIIAPEDCDRVDPNLSTTGNSGMCSPKNRSCNALRYREVVVRTSSSCGRAYSYRSYWLNNHFDNCHDFEAQRRNASIIGPENCTIGSIQTRRQQAIAVCVGPSSSCVLAYAYGSFELDNRHDVGLNASITVPENCDRVDPDLSTPGNSGVCSPKSKSCNALKY